MYTQPSTMPVLDTRSWCFFLRWVLKWCAQVTMRARLKMPVVFATFLIIISLYVYIHEIGFSQATVSDSHELSFFSLSSVRRFFTTQLTVPENVRALGTLNSTDGCRRLWLAGQSLWFDYKFNASLSPVWTRHNTKLTPVISSWWKVGSFWMLESG